MAPSIGDQKGEGNCFENRCSSEGWMKDFGCLSCVMRLFFDEGVVKGEFAGEGVLRTGNEKAEFESVCNQNKSL